MTHLTNTAIRKIPSPSSGQKDYRDPSLKGFCLRVSQGGTKTFTLVYGTPRKRVTIGRYPIVSLSEARTEARRILAEHQLGKTEPTSPTFIEAYDLFKAQHMSTYAASTFTRYSLYYDTHCKKLHHRFLHTLDVTDINSILDSLSPSEANHTFRAIRTFLNWCKKRGHILSAPTDILSQPHKERSRSRVLTDNEITAIWKATDFYPFGTIVRLLMLTACRRTEISGMHREWISTDVFTIPTQHTKNRTEHFLPITPLIQRELSKCPPNRGLLFPARGKPTNPFSGFGKCKERLDTTLSIPHWTLHDLRRTTATHMAELGVQPHIIERALNHSSGTISGVAAVYNRFHYADEVKAALTLWHDKIQALSDGAN